MSGDGGDGEHGWDNDGGDEFLTIYMMGRMGDDAGDKEDEDGVTMWMTVMMVILGMMQVMKWDDGFGWDDEGM